MFIHSVMLETYVVPLTTRRCSLPQPKWNYFTDM